MTKPCRCSAVVICPLSIAVMKDVYIIINYGGVYIHNGPVQCYQQQMLNLWNLKYRLHGTLLRFFALRFWFFSLEKLSVPLK